LAYQTGADDDRAVSAVFLEGYIGYKIERKSATVLIKGGRLLPAFGRYPLEYDDAKSPFIEPPSLYGVSLVLRPDQVPCNLRNILHQSYDDPIQFSCGGSVADRYGILPVTLYGIPGIEADVSWGRADGRIQVTNSSPANPQSILSRSQFAQWAAGAGYSLRGGLHIGVSGFRGPYLSRVVAPFLPVGTAVADFEASGVGIDAQWFGGPWSAEGEWQHFHFGVPGFIQSPALDGGYVQVKRILSPRLFVAGRSNWLLPGGATDSYGAHAGQIDAHQQTEEIVLGYRLNRLQLLKTGFSFSERHAWTVGTATWEGEQHYGFELQLVTSLAAISKGFH
jgi:hypothetical protein